MSTKSGGKTGSKKGKGDTDDQYENRNEIRRNECRRVYDSLNLIGFNIKWVNPYETTSGNRRFTEDIYAAQFKYLVPEFTLPVQGRYVFDYATKRAYLLKNNVEFEDVTGVHYYAISSTDAVILIATYNHEYFYYGCIMRDELCYVLVTHRDAVTFTFLQLNQITIAQTPGLASNQCYMTKSPGLSATAFSVSTGFRADGYVKGGASKGKASSTAPQAEPRPESRPEPSPPQQPEIEPSVTINTIAALSLEPTVPSVRTQTPAPTPATHNSWAVLADDEVPNDPTPAESKGKGKTKGDPHPVEGEKGEGKKGGKDTGKSGGKDNTPQGKGPG